MIENTHRRKPILGCRVFSVCKYANVCVCVCSVGFLSGRQSDQPGCAESAGSEVTSVL